ncbi:RNA-editing-associated protein 1 [Trypanosoma brucei equiperdum]|uniref:RNA-editing-associated protein 1 n=1 Tax=Trypanosoma brucei equiperdum TaxID=630700 RepID=A0A3L6KYM5_9TRYP|nr:RNA-editing-associated protein 1 [Trypanosoma brucei equiperdum]
MYHYEYDDDHSTNLSQAINAKLITRRGITTDSPDPITPVFSSTAPTRSSTGLTTEWIRHQKPSGRAVPPTLDTLKGTGSGRKYKSVTNSQENNVDPNSINRGTLLVNSSYSAPSPRYNHVSSVVKKLIEGRITPQEARRASSSRRGSSRTTRLVASSRFAPADRPSSAPKRLPMGSGRTGGLLPRLRISSTPHIPVRTQQWIPSNSAKPATAECQKNISPRGPATTQSSGSSRRLNMYQRVPLSRQCDSFPRKPTTVEEKPKPPQPLFSRVPRCAADIPDHRKPSPRHDVQSRRPYVPQSGREVPKAHKTPLSRASSSPKYNSARRRYVQDKQANETSTISGRQRVPVSAVDVGSREKANVSERQRVPVSAVDVGSREKANVSERQRVPVSAVDVGSREKANVSERQRVPVSAVDVGNKEQEDGRVTAISSDSRGALSQTKAMETQKVVDPLLTKDIISHDAAGRPKHKSLNGGLVIPQVEGIKSLLLFDIKPPKLSETGAVAATVG